MAYKFPLKYASGLKKKAVPKDDPDIPLSINDFFLHLMFARLTAKTGEIYEFKTDFNERTQQLELDIPTEYIDLITKLGIGDNMRQFLNWLVGGSISGTSTSTIGVDTFPLSSSASLSPQVISTVSVPANTLSIDGKGLHIRAWGSFGLNSNVKTVQLVLGSTTIATNDITDKPNGIGWMLDAYIIRTNVSEQEVNGTCLVGSIQQTPQLITSTEDETSVLDVSVICQNSVAVANDITARGLIVEAF